jgi:hypothetical protein
MLPQKAYTEAADEFGVSVGVAHAIGKGIKELKSKEEISEYNDDRFINGVIVRCIERNKYQELQRTLYRIRQQAGKRKLKEVTIYKKAWYYIVNGHDKRNKPKSGKVLEESR